MSLSAAGVLVAPPLARPPDERLNNARHSTPALAFDRVRGRVVAYLPREVFFGRLGLAGAFFSVWASDFGRFFPAKSGSFR